MGVRECVRNLERVCDREQESKSERATEVGRKRGTKR